MAGDGRRVKNSEKILKGNPSKDKNLSLSANLEAKRLSEKPPSFLTKRAKAIWKDFVEKIETSDNIYLSIDESFLARYCEYKAEWEKARDEVVENGITVEVRKFSKFGVTIEHKERPEFIFYKHGIVMLHRMENDLGMTPLARYRLRIENVPKDDEDALISFLNRRNEDSRK